MGLLDSDSESDDGGYSSFEESFRVDDEEPKKRGSSANIDGSDKSITEGSIEDRLKAMMSLKDNLGVDQDPEMQAKEAKKEGRREERRRLAGMSTEDRLKYQRSSAHDLMEGIKKKREQSFRVKKGDMNDLSAASAHSRKSVMDTSGHSCASSNLSDDEMDEFQKLKMKKKRGSKKKKKPVAAA